MLPTRAEERFAALARHLIANGHLAARVGDVATILVLDHAPDLPRRVRPIFHPDATPPQRAAALVVIDGWDWAPRRPRSVADIAQDLGANPQAVRLARVERLLAALIASDVTLPGRAGVLIEPEEPDAA